jgi:hypothetical protein
LSSSNSLLERQVERARLDLRRVRRLVDDELAVADLLAGRLLGGAGSGAPEQQPQPGVDLGGAGGVEHDVVDAPVRGDRDEPALGGDEQDRYVDPGRADEAAQAAHGRQVAASVDEHGLGRRRVEQGRALGREHPDAMGEQTESGQHLDRRR